MITVFHCVLMTDFLMCHNGSFLLSFMTVFFMYLDGSLLYYLHYSIFLCLPCNIPYVSFLQLSLIDLITVFPSVLIDVSNLWLDYFLVSWLMSSFSFDCSIPWLQYFLVSWLRSSFSFDYIIPYVSWLQYFLVSWQVFFAFIAVFLKRPE